MIEQDIYNKRIAELMKKKTSLIEMLDKLVSTRKPGLKKDEKADRLSRSSSAVEAAAGS